MSLIPSWPTLLYEALLVLFFLLTSAQGHEFNRSLYKAFYDLHIEDMWLPYFCNTTNIITSRMEIHETGYAWRYIRTLRFGCFEDSMTIMLRGVHDIGRPPPSVM